MKIHAVLPRVRAASGIATALAVALSSLAVTAALAPAVHGVKPDPLPDLGFPVSFGDNSDGQALAFAAPPGATRYIDVAASKTADRSFLALTDSGHILGTGSDWHGMFDVPELPAGAAGFADVSAGSSHALGLTDTGEVLAWGQRVDDSVTTVPALPGSAKKFVQIDAGFGHSMALTDDGQVVSWGSGSGTQGGPFTLPPGASSFTDIAAGQDHALALTDDGRIVARGDGEGGRTTIPVLTAPEIYVDIAATREHSYVVTSTGRAIALGGSPDQEHVVPAAPPESGGYVSVTAGATHFLLRTADGSVTGHRGSEGEQRVPEGRSFVAMDAGYRTSVFLTSTGEILATGSGASPVANLPDFSGNLFAAASAGGNHSAALDEDGTLKVRGVGVYGSSWGGGATPLLKAVAAGERHIVGITRQGALAGAGPEESVDFSTLPAGETYTAVAAGDDHSVALTLNGVIRAVGDDDYGQTTPPPLPQGAQQWVSIAAGAGFSMALSDTGEIHGAGQGFETSSTEHVPALPQGATSWVAIDAGGASFMALADNGAVRVGSHLWGTMSLELPEGAHRFVDIAAGRYRLGAVADTGEIVTSTPTGADGPSAPELEAGTGYVSLDAGSWHFVALTQELKPLTGASVTVVGEPVVEGVLEAQVAGLGGSDPITGGTSVSYQWFADGAEVWGATERQLRLTPELVDKQISVRARLVRFRHEVTHVDAPQTARVAPGVQKTPLLTIEGTAKVGHALSARVAGLAKDSEVSVAWRRGTTVVSTSATYTASAADAGQRLEVTATVTRPGFRAESVSASSPEIAPGDTSGPTPTPTPTASSGPTPSGGPVVSTPAAPEVSVKASKSALRLGESVVLSWESTHADEVTGSWSATPLAARGSVTLTPKMVGQQSWRLTATNVRASATASVEVDVALPAAKVGVGTTKQVRSQKRFAATVSGLAPSEQFTALFGKQRVTGVADSNGAARVQFLAPLKNRALWMALQVRGSASDRSGSVRVKILGRKILATPRKAVVRASERQVVTLTRLGKNERIVIVHNGESIAARASKYGIYKHRFAATGSSGPKKARVIASRTGRSVSVTWRVRR